MHDKSVTSDLSHLVRMMFFTALFISMFNCTLHSATREFTYNGIAYEVLDEESMTCSTRKFCCDYDSEHVTSGCVVIPEEARDENGLTFKVVKIGDDSFNNNDQLLQVEIPESVTEIGGSAFWSCDSLQTVVLHEGLSKIGDMAFAYCRSLKSISFPFTLKWLEYNAFRGCESLQNVDMSNSNIHLYEGVFSECTNLKSAKLPQGLTYLPSELFYNCTSLESVEIPSTVKWLDGYDFFDFPLYGVFQGCTSLRKIVLPDNLETIGRGAFCDCMSLETVTLSKELVRIKADAFIGCSSLSKIIYPVSRPKGMDADIGSDHHPTSGKAEYGFTDDQFDRVTLQVLPGGAETALETEPWKYFKHIEEVDFSGVGGIESDATNSTSDGVYRMDGTWVGDSTEGLPSGLYIVREGGKTSKFMVP